MELELFPTLSECSVALTGFGAILGALRGADTPRGVFRAWTVVFQAAAALVLSLAPIVLAAGPLSDEALWRVASFGGFVVAAGVVGGQIWVDSRLSRAGHPPQAPVMIRSAQSAGVLSSIALLVNALITAASFLHAIAVFLLIFSALTALLHSFLVPLQLTMREIEHERTSAPSMAGLSGAPDRARPHPEPDGDGP
jgi:hypothetical protein